MKINEEKIKMAIANVQTLKIKADKEGKKTGTRRLDFIEEVLTELLTSN